MGIEVCVGNWGYYNEGTLVDKWVELPMDAVELERWLENSGVRDEEHEEIYISDYDGIPLGMRYGKVFSEYTRLEDLNILAAVMDEHPDETERAEKIFGLGCDEPEDVIEACNLILQIDEYPYFSYGSEIDLSLFEHDSEEMKFGYYLAEIDGTMRYLQEHDLENYFDFEAYGKGNSDNCYLGDEGYIDAVCDFPSMNHWSRDEIIEHLAGSYDMRGYLSPDGLGELAYQELKCCDILHAGKTYHLVSRSSEGVEAVGQVMEEDGSVREMDERDWRLAGSAIAWRSAKLVDRDPDDGRIGSEAHDAAALEDRSDMASEATREDRC